MTNNYDICIKLNALDKYYYELFEFVKGVSLDDYVNNIITVEFALKIAPSTGMRNILVHEYQKINDEIVYTSISNIKEYYRIYIDKLKEIYNCNS